MHLEKETSAEEKESLNFIEQIIEEDNVSGKFDGRVHTRFPPEPNGYLHIGHAKAIVTSYGIAQRYKGLYNLRLDDTNPEKEDVEYAEAIKADIKWLGYDWEDREFHASDYFDRMYELAGELIKLGKAYVDESTPDEMRVQRGTPTQPGTESPFRNRDAAESFELFQKMANGDFEEGRMILRAKIDMTSPNMHMRDPAIYRIKKADHPVTGGKWKVYPMYDFAHCISDSIEGITHSLCSLEFAVHRPLYDWILETLGLYRPQQIEFARLNLNYTVMSKRKLRQLVDDQVVDGWDDPRMPTISALRRRGYTPQSIVKFAETVGVAKRNNVIDVSLLEFSVREDLNKKTDRVMAVLDPLKVVITNYPSDKTEELDAVNNPEDENGGVRKLPFSNEIYIEREDFLEDAPRKFFRLKPEGMVRLKFAYIIQCDEVIKDDKGDVVELRCSYFENSKSGEDTSGLKVKGTIHWVDAKESFQAEVRLYDRLFVTSEPDKSEEGQSFMDAINPESLQILTNCRLEPSLKSAAPGTQVQFQRKGYFCVDTKYSKPGQPVFNRTVTLKDSWAKKNK